MHFFKITFQAKEETKLRVRDFQEKVDRKTTSLQRIGSWKIFQGTFCRLSLGRSQGLDGSVRSTHSSQGSVSSSRSGEVNLF